MSSRSDRRSKRKHSKADSYNSQEPEPEPESAHYDQEFVLPLTWPPPSFLFTVNELPINDEPSRGGEAPRANENGRWYPPIRSNGFGAQRPRSIYRWSEGGRISAADECQLFNNRWWSSAGDGLVEYRASTLFWCNNFTEFMVATGDASTRHMDESPHPQNRWWPLSFRHEGTLSRVEEVGEESRLAGSGNWVNDLGLSSYRSRHTTPAGGLAGNVAIVIGLVAFSCESRHLPDILVRDRERAWRWGTWHGHNRRDGRDEGRGIVVTVYLDPENEQGSTPDTIYPLEWSLGPLVR